MFFFARVVTNDPTAECGALVRIKVVATELATSYSANRVDKVGAVEVFKSVLIRIMCVGTAVKIVSRRISRPSSSRAYWEPVNTDATMS